VDKKWLMMKEAIIFKKTVGSTKITDLTNLGIFLYEVSLSESTIRAN
jgi:hypothetical protein